MKSSSSSKHTVKQPGFRMALHESHSRHRRGRHRRSKVLSRLVGTGAQIRALARNPGAVRLPPQVEVVRGDLTLPETLDGSLDGIDAVILVWTAPPTAITPALGRIVRQAWRIVFLSALLKTVHPLFQQRNPLRATFEQIERLIETSGIQWTFLRPGMFAANALRWWAPQIRAGDIVRWPYVDAPTAPIDERDIPAVAVRALCEDGHACRRREYTARRLGCRNRPNCARYVHSFRDHGSTPHTFLDWATDNAVEFRM
jgi:uncharacterized protein YbjT (DUF2867 family)